jgi:ADP-heptose:LPS heptosyltransferase
VVTLLAPSSSGAALLGGGPADAQRLLGWDRAEMAALLTADGPGPGALADELAGFDAAIAYTRSPDLVRTLEKRIPRVVAHDPIPPAQGAHASEWLARPLAGLGLDADGFPPPCAPSPEEAAAAASLAGELGPAFLAVHPGSGSREKNWPAERFASLVRAMAAGAPWLLVAGPADAAAVAPLDAVPGRRGAPGLPLRVLGALLSRARLYVGNDSGVSHLAAAWAAPTLALFGPTDPAVWAPQGARVSVVRSPTRAMSDITLHDVLDAARSLSSSWPPRPTSSVPSRPCS